MLHPQQFLAFLLLPHLQGEFLPTFIDTIADPLPAIIVAIRLVLFAMVCELIMFMPKFLPNPAFQLLF